MFGEDESGHDSCRKYQESQENNCSWLEGCEKDGGLKKLLLPQVGFLDALHNLQEKDRVKIFAALYSFAVGMSFSEAK